MTSIGIRLPPLYILYSCRWQFCVYMFEWKKEEIVAKTETIIQDKRRRPWTTTWESSESAVAFASVRSDGKVGAPALSFSFGPRTPSAVIVLPQRSRAPLPCITPYWSRQKLPIAPNSPAVLFGNFRRNIIGHFAQGQRP